MDNSDSLKYTIRLSFENIKLPPFHDIVVLGTHCLHEKVGLSKLLELLVPNSFDFFEINDERVEAVFINKKLLVKMNFDTIIGVLRSNVFPFVAEGELLKVDFKVAFFYSQIESF